MDNKFPENAQKRYHLLNSIQFWHLLLIWWIPMDIGLSIHLLSNINSLTEIIKVFFIFATNLSALAKFVSVRIFNRSYTSVFESMYNKEFLPLDAEEHRIYMLTVERCRSMRNKYATLSIMALLTLMCFQAIFDPGNLPLSTYNPFDLTIRWHFIVAYIYQFISISLRCLTNIAFDSLAASFFIYIKGQIDILAYRLENIGKNTNFDEVITYQLKDCMRLYGKLLDLAETMESHITKQFSIQIFCSVLVLIANFYAMTTGFEVSSFVTYHICMMTQIFIICYYPNELSICSGELSYAVYKSNWIAWNHSNKKLALLMMLRFNTPIHIRTVNRCYSFNLNMFTSIVNSSYSYFALLKKMNN
ncbi:odorant receptor 46a-like [Teleopsis dalmanni]|uniref:odorant receptor 46a-like n=1 Tax=Teleopsis dalmanni TaxID=139649 RepID=UPI0018CF2353|nr:odorant receptor 46a-like [Teleopsis dalmanni]